VPGPPTVAAPTAAAPQAEPLPPIDWAAEQDQVAESKGRENWKQLSQHCRDAEALHIHPPECHRYVAPEPWEPEEKRFGLAGPLPYVRLGQCVLGLGFWGCAVGKPPPNGHRLEGMRDPDRPSSMPDNGSYQAPPEAREPRTDERADRRASRSQWNIFIRREIRKCMPHPRRLSQLLI
jgi:hypothetical protein